MDANGHPNPRPLAGPAFGPAERGPAQWLMVLLHGVGADGNDLIGLAPYFAETVPGARILAPDGPEPCDMVSFGRQWFSLIDRSAEAVAAGVVRAAVDVEAFVASELERLGLDGSRLILAGFSQGAMIALHVALRRTVAPAAVLAFSGALVAADRLGAEIRVRPPVLITHGAEDEVVPASQAPAAEAALAAAGVPVEAHVLPGLGHGIDERALGLARKFLQRLGIAA